MKFDESGRNLKVFEQINRLKTWREEVDQAIQVYKSYIKITLSKIEVHLGHDDQVVVEGLTEL